MNVFLSSLFFWAYFLVLFFKLLSGRIPVRLYVWSVSKDFDDLEDAPQIDSWDQISYMNRPVEIHREEGKLRYALFDVRNLLLGFCTSFLIKNKKKKKTNLVVLFYIRLCLLGN